VKNPVQVISLGLFVLLFFFIASFSYGQNGLLKPQQQANDFLSSHKQRIKQLILQKALANQTPATVYESYDARYYKLKLRISYQPQMLYGIVTARLTSRSDSLTRITFDMDNLLQVDSIGGAAVGYSHDGALLHLQLEHVYRLNEDLTVFIKYHGNPSASEYLAFRTSTMPNGSSYVWTLSEPYGAHYWWPCKDTPADKADSVDIIVTVPEDQIVGSNGTLRSVTTESDSTRTYHWQERYPITTYLVSLVAGSYAHFQNYYHYSLTDSMLLDYYVFPSELTAADTIFSEMDDYLDALTHYFGPYPFLKEKYGMAHFGWGGGMEHQTLTSIGLVTPFWRFLYVHELAHQWFGDAVTCATWQDIWLNEGFASYAEALYAEWSGYNGLPPGADAYHAYINHYRYTDDGTIFVSDTTEVSNIFDRIVYQKGAWVLHMLRHVLGDSVFFDVLKSYVRDPRWAYGSVHTENFKTVCEEKSGKMLDTFFNQWLHFPFYPKYEYQWSYTRSGPSDYELSLKINQTQTIPIYEMPIDVYIAMTRQQDTLITVKNDRAEQTYRFHLPLLPTRVLLDKDNWILKDATEKEGPGETYSNRIEFSTIYPNPFHQQLRFQTKNWFKNHSDVDVFDIRGQYIITLHPIEQVKHNYFYNWDGKNHSGQKVASGIYLLRPHPDASGGIVPHKSARVVLIR